MSVTCNKCGEELMGAVNRCWKCGTPFARIERDLVPPIRRSPILASYLTPPERETDEPALAIVEDEWDSEEVVEPIPSDPFRVPKELLQKYSFDFPSIGTSILSVVACWILGYSIVGIPLGAAAAILSVRLLNQRRSKTRWVGFVLGIAAMLSTLASVVSQLYFWSTGISLSYSLFGP